MIEKFARTRRAVLCLAGALLLAGPALAETIRGNGSVKTQARAASGFTGVGLGLHAKVEVRLGSTESVTVEADDNLLPLIETRVERGTLEIRPVRNNLRLDSRAIHIVVQARNIDHLAIGGGGSISADTLRSGKLEVEIGGSGRVEVKRIESDRVNVAVGGSGDVEIAGITKVLDVSIGGSGDVKAGKLVADDVQVSIGGSGDSVVAARNQLSVAIAGAGDVQYYGDPRVSRTVVGSGSIKRVGPLPN